MSLLTNFGEQFASRVLAKTYQSAVFESIVNKEYEGEIKKPGDRVNILSFLNDILLSDYAVGTDMNSETIVDEEDQLIVEKRKYYNFSLDRLEDLFAYARDIPEHLIDNSERVLSRTIDAYVLDKFGSEVKAGNWIGVDIVVEGALATQASIVTTATGGTLTIDTNVEVGGVGTGPAPIENPRDGLTYSTTLEANMLYKGIRLRSTAAFVTPWYRISSVTNTMVCDITEWDEETSGSDFEEGYTLRGLFGGDGKNFPKYGAGEASFDKYAPCGWEIQAAAATAVSATSIYDQVTLLAEALDDNEVPADQRHFTVNPQIVTQFRQSAEMQPSGIAEIFTGTVINGRVMRVGAFDVHSAAGARMSSRVGASTSTGGIGATLVLVPGSTGYMLAANHIGFMTYADKWSESRVVDAENQFAKKYQGLYLFGAKVPHYRRKYGAILFGSF